MVTPIPQPQETILIGNLREIDPNFLSDSLQKLHKLYGDIYRLTLFGQKIVVVCNQELVNFVCDESKFDKKIVVGLDEMRAVIGDGLVTAHTSEPNWSLAHKILIPAFGPHAMRDMFPEMMDIASQLILRWEYFTGEEIDVCDNFTRLTLDTIGLCIFNYRFNSFYQQKIERFASTMVDVLAEAVKRSKRLPIQNTLMVETARKYNADIAYVHRLCDEIVKKRREHPTDTNDMLNRMIKGTDPETGYRLSDENIRYQMLTFLFAGHETTSGLLSFTFYHLLKNPHVLQKAQAEADKYEEITCDILTKLNYIEAVLKETLRLQPVVRIFTLKSKEGTVTLPGGYEIHRDDTIFVLLPELHRDPKVWDRPEEFLPERMLNEGFKNLPPNSWKPFGNGQRGCIGRSFAMQESLLAVALILKHFNIEFVDPSYDLRIKETVTTKPEGFKMRVRPRTRPKVPLNTPVKQAEKKPIQTKESDSSHIKPMCILFGSNSGSCESFAETLASEAPTHGFDATVATLDSAVESIPSNQPVIIITSCYEGKPCNNAKQFVAYLESKPELKITYAVFGAGNHDWVNTYQKIPIFIDETIEKAGGIRIVERGVGDAAGDFFGDFEAWKENLFEVLEKGVDVQNVTSGEETSTSNEKPSTNNRKPSTSKETLSIEIVKSTRNVGQIIDIGIVKEKKLLTEVSELGPTKLHIEIELPKGQTYRAGDYLAVLPKNPVEVIRRVLQRFNLTTDTQIKISSSIKTFLPTGYPVSAFDILSGYVELTQAISRKQIKTLADLCQDEKEQTELANLDGDAYQTAILNKRLSTLDILELYPSCGLSFPQYLSMLSSLRVRQYSISSSPLWNSEVVTLTLDILDAPALSGHGRHYGVASNYLAKLEQGDRLNCSVRASNADFHLPADTNVPVVMFAAGTGIAPFRGFIQERAAQVVCGRKVGPTILYFGCRSHEDFLYANELEQWSKLGAIQVKTAFSRPVNGDKKYVQDLLWEDRKEITKMAHEGTRFYTCGSATKLAASIKTCFINIIREHHQCDEKKAAEILEKESVNRYSVDVFA